ncbi:MAG: hypothetical protein M1837_006740 [Sclerophora amabilis]|nr:MAG: hypothetical protein M1837_006740 [Sclerophora amabilis]
MFGLFSASQLDFRMIKVAIAGTGGLAQYIAQHIDQDTSHQFVLLSREDKPGLNANGFQVIVVDYDDAQSLRYALFGIDTVISTVSGVPQLNLIEAAVSCGVRRFAPAEFEGPPSVRPVDILDRLKDSALERLRYYSSQIESTVFICGILYERFAPGGMVSCAIGLGTGISGEGEFLVNVRNLKAEIPYDPSGRIINVCMTSASDVARFVVRALDFAHWPTELSMLGERMAVYDIVHEIENMSGQRLETVLQTAESLTSFLIHYQSQYDLTGQLRTQSMIDTLEGRYDYADSTLNGLVDFRPIGFGEWLRQVWAA